MTGNGSQTAGGTGPVRSPLPSSEAAFRRMTRQRRRDTRPELLLRRRLHAMGLRYRVDFRLPGIPRRRADIVFPRLKIAVLVMGCFWHACEAHGTAPVANSEWWSAKLAANVARDDDTRRRLRDSGWDCIEIWEHEDLDAAAARVATAVRVRRAAVDSAGRHSPGSGAGAGRSPGRVRRK